MLTRQARRSLILVVVALVAFMTLSCVQAEKNAPTEQAIAASEYQSNFVDTSAAHLLVDVRTPEEFATGHIAGAVNIPLDTLESRLGEVPKDTPIVLYCRTGNRSAQAADLLEGAGYSDIRDLGGILDWTAAGYPVE